MVRVDSFSLKTLLAVVLLVGVAVLSLSRGASDVSLLTFFDALAGRSMDWEREVVLTIFQLRWDRLLLGLCAGGALALAGASLQALFRNDLADPAVLGVSSGAAVAAAGSLLLAGVFSLPALLVPVLAPLCAILGALGVIMFLYFLSRREDSLHLPTLLLAGIAVNALSGAVIALLISLAPAEEMRSFAFWTLGTLARAEAGTNWLLLGLILVPVLYLLSCARSLNLFSLGEVAAVSLGENISRRKTGIFLAVAMVTGASVAFCGIIGFVGLVIPHITRFIVGADNRKVLIYAVILGGVAVVLSDVFCRTIVAPMELPLGVVTSAIGAPFFLYLLIRSRHA